MEACLLLAKDLHWIPVSEKLEKEEVHLKKNPNNHWSDITSRRPLNEAGIKVIQFLLRTSLSTSCGHHSRIVNNLMSDISLILASFNGYLDVVGTLSISFKCVIFGH